MLRALNPNRIIDFQVEGYLPVKVDTRILGLHDTDFNPVAITYQYGPVRQ